MATEFSDEKFWNKVKGGVSTAGQVVIGKALELYYSLRQPNTPAWAKTAITGALVYFILPFDTVPDFIPGLGYTDDAAVLTAALATVNHYISDETRQRAAQKLRDWFRK